MPRSRVEGKPITFCGIGFAVVAENTINLLSLFLGHESLEYIFAKLCFLSSNRLAHFLKLCSACNSIEPNHLRLLLLFGEEVSSVVFQKATSGIVCDVRHLGAIWLSGRNRERQDFS